MGEQIGHLQQLLEVQQEVADAPSQVLQHFAFALVISIFSKQYCKKYFLCVGVVFSNDKTFPL